MKVRIGLVATLAAALPGLAVDPGAARPFVFGARLVAEIELRNMAVRYHDVGKQTEESYRRPWIRGDPRITSTLDACFCSSRGSERN